MLCNFFFIFMDIFFWLNLNYHHETMRPYIHDPDTTLNFDLKVNLLGVWHVFVSGP